MCFPEGIRLLKHLHVVRAWEDVVNDVSLRGALVIELISAFSSSFDFRAKQRCGPV